MLAGCLVVSIVLNIVGLMTLVAAVKTPKIRPMPPLVPTPKEAVTLIMRDAHARMRREHERFVEGAGT